MKKGLKDGDLYRIRSKRRELKDPERKWDFEAWYFVVAQNLKCIWTATKLLFGLKRKKKRKKKVNRISKTTRIAMLGPNAKCVRCGDGWDKKTLTLDHIIPASKGGKGHRKNCQVMCEKCNNAKGDKTRRYHQPELKVSLGERAKFNRECQTEVDRRMMGSLE